MLRKDKMLDEDIARLQDLDQETTEQKVVRLEGGLDTIYTRFGRLLAEFNSMQLKLKKRVAKLEKRVLVDPDDGLEDDVIDNPTVAKETKNAGDGGKSSSVKRSDSLDSPDGSARRKSFAQHLGKTLSTESNTSDVAVIAQSPIAEESTTTEQDKEVDATEADKEVAATEADKEIADEPTEAKKEEQR